MSISTKAEAIKIPQQQADLLSTLLRLPPESPVDAVSRLVLKDRGFCDRLIDIVHPRRPPNVDDALIHEGIRDLGVERVRLLFVSNNISQAFSTAKLRGFDETDFWIGAIQKGCMAYCIAKDVEYADTFEAFSAGLMSNIGNLLLAARFPHMSEHLKDNRSRCVSIRAEVERILLGSNHCEEVQNSGLTHLIPPRTIHAITTYLDPFPGFERKYALATIVATAVSLAEVQRVIPAAAAHKLAERHNKSLSKSVRLDEIYEEASNMSHQLCKDLGFTSCPPQRLQDVLDGKLPVVEEEADPLANLFRFTMEKTVANRNGFLEKLDEALQDPRRSDDLSIMLVDLDSFSKINDTYGCPTADALLQHLGSEIARSMRPMDLVAKIDADQFALLMPKTQVMGGKVVAERIRALVKGSTIAMGTIRPNCTASVGGLTIKTDRKIPPADKVWQKVEDLVKMAKDKGKNRIIWAS
jgi:diguanylate cyclase (GGDEF)-like protein